MNDQFEPLYGIDERPPWGKSITAAAAHLLAIVGGIATAPLIIARGLGLNSADTNYVVACALTISGLATFIQVKRLGIVGSGMLSVQGTSFAFVGVFIYAGLAMQSQGIPQHEVLGTLLGTAAVGGLLVCLLSFFLEKLGKIITANVAGIVIFLLGLSLVWIAFGNLQFAVLDAAAQGISEFWVWAQAAIVVGTIVMLSTRTNPWIKLSSIVLGLLAGLAFAFVTNTMGPAIELPQQAFQAISWMPFAWQFDAQLLLLLLPIFLITITESIGDLTATSVLSKREVIGPSYWQRIRGGILADGINTIIAAVAGTFPNTTFSQNNGVIRLTGVASRTVGIVLAGLLILLGMVPLFSAFFQMLPGGVLHGATGLMFAMIMVTGWRVLLSQPNPKRSMVMLACCTAFALLLTQASVAAEALGAALPEYLQMLTNFPVATGALVAMIWEVCALALTTNAPTNTDA